MITCTTRRDPLFVELSRRAIVRRRLARIWLAGREIRGAFRDYGCPGVMLGSTTPADDGDSGGEHAADVAYSARSEHRPNGCWRRTSRRAYRTRPLSGGQSGAPSPRVEKRIF